jgi:imidazolonepropionase-like amidohydrolase
LLLAEVVGLGSRRDFASFVEDSILRPLGMNGTRLVRRGMVLAALACATSGAASVLGMADTVGAIAPGMRADLVLLEADPRLDIRNARKIVAVIAGGRLVPLGQRSTLR